jgi:hypothetical protein
MLPARPVSSSYKEDTWGNRVSPVWESVRGGVSWKGAAIQRDLRSEAEESLLLVAVTRERLVKTHQAGKGLVGAVTIAVAL